LKPILFEVKYRPVLSGISYYGMVRIRTSDDIQMIKYRPIMLVGPYNLYTYFGFEYFLLKRAYFLPCSEFLTICLRLRMIKNKLRKVVTTHHPTSEH